MFQSPCSLRSTQCATLIALAAAAGIMRIEQADLPTEQASPKTTESCFTSQPRNHLRHVGPVSAWQSFSVALLGSTGNFASDCASASRLSRGQNSSAVPAFDFEGPALVAASASEWTYRIHSLALAATKRCFSAWELQDVAEWKFETASDAGPPMARLVQARVDPSTDSVDSNADSSPIIAAGCDGMFSAGTIGAPSARQHSYPYAVGPPRTRANSNPRADDTSVSGDLAACRKSGLQVALCFQLPIVERLMREPDRASKQAGTFSEPSFALRGEPEHLERSFVGSPGAILNRLDVASSSSFPV